MNGQWIGRYEGTTAGKIIVNIDARGSFYEGVAYIFEDEQGLPASAAFFKTPDKNANAAFRTDYIGVIDPTSANPAPWNDNLKKQFPRVEAFSKYADVQLERKAEALSIRWKTDTGVDCHCTLPRSKADQPSELPASEMNWLDFKKFVSDLELSRPIFRGQNGRWRLRTSFHRTGRADLARFVREDVPVLHRYLSARTRHIFNLSDPDQNGAFLNLIQHHGYPTPLLDWSYSPFVAAYFAYRGLLNSSSEKTEQDDKVRILILDQAQWTKDWQQLLLLACPWPHLSVGEFIAIENERMIPQQAASTVTSIDDIETYVRSRESAERRYLWAIDLPLDDRKVVLRELRWMGITAGSLFPGLDGACEELRERNFEV